MNPVPVPLLVHPLTAHPEAARAVLRSHRVTAPGSTPAYALDTRHLTPRWGA